MKKVIIGFIIGAVVCSSSGAFAETTSRQVNASLRGDISIVVDGKKLNLNNRPINYAGSVYLPMRDTASALNKNVDWDSSTLTVTLSEKEKPILEGYVSMNAIFRNFNRLGYGFPYDPKTKKMSLIRYNSEPHDNTDFTLIIEDVPYKVLDGMTYISRDFYLNNIISLLEDN